MGRYVPTLQKAVHLHAYNFQSNVSLLFTYLQNAVPINSYNFQNNAAALFPYLLFFLNISCLLKKLLSSTLYFTILSYPASFYTNLLANMYMYSCTIQHGYIIIAPPAQAYCGKILIINQPLPMGPFIALKGLSHKIFGGIFNLY